MSDKTAWQYLAENQRQLDMDGCEVGVSRQALDETLTTLRQAQADNDRLRGALSVYAHSGFWQCDDIACQGCFKDDKGKMAFEVLHGGAVGHWRAYVWPPKALSTTTPPIEPVLEFAKAALDVKTGTPRDEDEARRMGQFNTARHTFLHGSHESKAFWLGKDA